MSAGATEAPDLDQVKDPATLNMDQLEAGLRRYVNSETVFVSVWKPGELTTLPGSPSMAGMELQVDGQELVLTGGLINAVGAGLAQRVRTDRYGFDGEQLRLVDRRCAESPYGYHR